MRRQTYAGRPGQTISVTAERFRPGWAARSMDDVRRVLDVCVRYEYTDASTDFLDASTPVQLRRGDRVAQLEVQRVDRARFIEVASLPGSARGAGGYGSTGGFEPRGAPADPRTEEEH